ncbi:methyltransferase family protein [Thiovulum sp. ES]|nr:methyltransferase family protein [Thiovulum sp. ES]
MIKCNLCESENYKTIATEIREGEGLIVQCEDCGHFFQAIELNSDELEEYYNDIYTATNSLQETDIEVQEHFEERFKTLDNLISHLNPYLKDGDDVLDIGAGAGSLLYAIKDNVSTLSATELNKSYVEYMKSLNIYAYYGFFEKLSFPKQYDLIISINAIDHMPNPTTVLEEIYKSLKEDGRIYLELPNRNEALNFFLPEENRKKFNKFFWHKAHYSYFYEETIYKLLDKIGFKNIKVANRHEYTIVNYLNWYFTGEPQKRFVDATTNTKLFSGSNSFELEMNSLFEKVNSDFLDILKKNKRGDTLIITANK